MTIEQAGADTAPTAPDATAAGIAPPDIAGARRILALLQDDDIDAAIDAGLARFTALTALDDRENLALAEARDRLLAAWAARARHRARALRLEHIAEARRRGRSARPPAAAAPTGTASDPAPGDPAAAPSRPALPVAAAAALARARARAAGRQA